MQQNFNHYNLVMEIARKASSIVYLAHNASNAEHKIIVKVFDPACFFSQDERERFLIEVEALKHLRHPYIVPVMDAGINEGGQGFIVSDYLPGGSLRAQLDSLSPQYLPFRTAISIILQVGKALTYAHNQAIVHGAVTPDNIYFDANGAALVTNFSLASIAENVKASLERDAGTSLYQAPEQLDGTSSVRCDQYALGCIAYELLTGRSPFSDGTVSSAQPAGLVPPTSIVATLPESLDEAILKALSRESSGRYADISDFLLPFQSVLQPHPPEFPLPRSMRRTTPQTGDDLRRTSSVEHHSSAQATQTEQISRLSETETTRKADAEPVADREATKAELDETEEKTTNPPVAPVASIKKEINVQSSPTLVANEKERALSKVPHATGKLHRRSASTDPISEEQSVEALAAMLRISQMEQVMPEPSLPVSPSRDKEEAALSNSMQTESVQKQVATTSNQPREDKAAVTAIAIAQVAARERPKVQTTPVQPRGERAQVAARERPKMQTTSVHPHPQAQSLRRVIFRGGGLVVFAVVGALVSYVLSPLDVPLQNSLAHSASGAQPVTIAQNQPMMIRPTALATPTILVPQLPTPTPKPVAHHNPPKAQPTPVPQNQSGALVPPAYQLPTPTPVPTTPKTTGQGTTPSTGTQTPHPTPTPAPATTSGNSGFSGYYYIANRFSGLVLDDTNWSTSDGTIIQQWSEVSGQSNQEWEFISAGNGYYYIANRFSGLVLDDTNWSTSDGTMIQQWSIANGQSDQEWSLNATGDGYYYIVNRFSGLVLDDTNWSTSSGSQIQQWSEVSGQTDQEWRLQQA